MKRAFSQAFGGGGLNDFELRNDKVQKINVFKKDLFQTLSAHDILNQILALVQKLRWKDLWIKGEICLFESKFDDGDIFARVFKYNVTFAEGLFMCWHNFLRDVTNKKAATGFSKWLTIQSCTYYSKSRSGLHSWESFHRSNMVITDMEFESSVEDEN